MKRDLRSPLERSIDKLVSTYADSSQLGEIERGDLSILNARYGIDFDNHAEHWCFRAGSSSEAEKEEQYENVDLCDNQTKDLTQFLRTMLIDACNAVSNWDYRRPIFESYSKYLAPALFKYKKDTLIIQQLPLNTVDLYAVITCFDWIPYDRNGQDRDRNHIEDAFEICPIKNLSSKKQMNRWAHEAIEHVFEDRRDLMTIDNVDIYIKGITLDVSTVNRNAFDSFYTEHNLSFFKRHASYRKDHEVLTTRKTWLDAKVLPNRKCIQFARLIYILKVGRWFTDQTERILYELMSNTHPHIITLEEDDVETLDWIITEHLSSQETCDSERGIYYDLFGFYPPLNNNYDYQREWNELKHHFYKNRYIDQQFAEELFSLWDQ